MFFEFEISDDLISKPVDRFASIKRNQDFIPKFKSLSDLENDKETRGCAKETINLINYLYLSKRYKDCLDKCMDALNTEDSGESYGLQQKPTTHGKTTNGNIRTLIDSAVRCAIKVDDKEALSILLKEAIIQKEFDFGFWVTRILILNSLGYEQECFLECLSYLKKRPHDIIIIEILIRLPIHQEVRGVLTRFYNLNICPGSTMESFAVTKDDLNSILRHELLPDISAKDL